MHRHRARRAQGKRPHLKLRAGIVIARGVRLGLAFVPSHLALAGAGDVLLAQLSPYFPGLPVMLVSSSASERRAYASFDSAPLLADIDLASVPTHEIDLDVAPPDTRELPF